MPKADSIDPRLRGRDLDALLDAGQIPQHVNGPEHFVGGAWYELACGPVRRRLFVASATDRRDFDLDLRREVAVSVRCPETIRPGVPLDVHVDVRRLGTGGQDARHRLALRLHNATCDRPTQTVDLAGKDSATVSFRLMPQRPCEPLLVLAVPDGELAKRGEWMGVVGAAE